MGGPLAAASGALVVEHRPPTRPSSERVPERLSDGSGSGPMDPEARPGGALTARPPPLATQTCPWTQRPLGENDGVLASLYRQ